MAKGATRTDKDLLDAWAAGDNDAGDALVERHFDVVHRFFMYRAGAIASDLVQQTFLACVESRDRMVDVVSFRAFLLGIARNLLLRHLRKEDVRKRALGKGPVQSDPDRTVRGLLALREEQKLLVKALRTLSLDLQLSLELYYWEELSAAEVAAVLEIPRGTVLNRLFRARIALRERIEEMAANAELASTTTRDLEGWARSLRRHLGRSDGSADEPT